MRWPVSLRGMSMHDIARLTNNVRARIELADLFEAYADCRLNKRGTINALSFELDYENELIKLHDEINTGRYQIGRSMAFIVDKPVTREIFAADFRDRVVHHLIINKLNPLFEKDFIFDSYACRKGRGSHMGIARVAGFIRKCSRNYTKDAYVLKLDIQGFFMAIDKRILWTMLRDFIHKSYLEPDKEWLLMLCHQVLSNNPTKNCIIKGKPQKWRDLPPNKSLFYSAPSCGLPIGNLTSQIFANVYLNKLDHFIKHELGVRYYGRYTDDFVLVHESREHLKAMVPRIERFLKDALGLTLHPRKRYLQHHSKGVPFLGVIIKPHRITTAKRTKGNFYDAIARQNVLVADTKPTREEQSAFLCSMNSYLGIMKHYQTYGLRKRMLIKHLSIWWWNLVYFSGGCAKLVLKTRTVR